MIEASAFEVSEKPAFEPSELIDHGDASDLTRASGNGAGNDQSSYAS